MIGDSNPGSIREIRIACDEDINGICNEYQRVAICTIGNDLESQQFTKVFNMNLVNLDETLIATATAGISTFDITRDECDGELPEDVNVTVQFTAPVVTQTNIPFTFNHVTTDSIDFASIPSGSLTFEAGEISKTLSIPVECDDDIEPNETLSIKSPEELNTCIFPSPLPDT